MDYLERVSGGKHRWMQVYGQYCPVARGAEILADRWTVLIVRELLSDIRHFNELERGLPHISRTLLAQRLRRLERVGVVERRAAPRGKSSEYRLKPAGRELQGIIDAFGEWGARWAFGEPRPDELDPVMLLWWMRRRVCLDRLAGRRVVIQFNFRGSKQHYWLVVERDEVSVCINNPGYDVDVLVGADLKVLFQVWLGQLTFAEAVRRSQVRLDGIPADVRAFSQWFAWSPMAEKVRDASAHCYPVS